VNITRWKPEPGEVLAYVAQDEIVISFNVPEIGDATVRLGYEGDNEKAREKFETMTDADVETLVRGLPEVLASHE